jgi:hypothetical protein
MAATPMPARNERSAPVFKKPDDIGPFFEEFEILCAHHNVATDEEKIEMSVRYLPAEHSRTWKATLEFEDRANTTYADFKAKIISMYPGSIHNSDEYTLGELETLVDTSRSMSMKTRAQLGAYYREFVTGQSNLKKKHNGALLSANQANKMFMDGFPDDLAKTINLRLMLSNPNRDSDLAYTIDEVFKTAEAILSGRPGAGVALLGPQATVVKQEDVESLVQRSMNSQISAFETRLAAMLATVSTATQHAPQILAPAAPRYNGAARTMSSGDCYYCENGPHLARDCDKVREDLKKGLVIPDPANPNRLVLPNRRYIPGLRYYPNISAQRDRMLQWHKEQSGKRDAPPHLTSNFLSFSDCDSDNEDGTTSMSGYNLSMPPISPARTKELIDEDADPVSQFLMQQIAQLAPHDPLRTVYVNEIEKRRKDVADGISKRVSSRSNKGKPPVRFSDDVQRGHPNADVYRRPAREQIVRDLSDDERSPSPPPAPLRTSAPIPTISSAPTAPVPLPTLASVRASSAFAPVIPIAAPAPGPRPPAARVPDQARIIYPAKIPRPAGPAVSRNLAPIEERTNIGGLVNKMLDIPLPHMTTRDFLGSSYTARRELMSQLSAKKAPLDAPTPFAASANFSSRPSNDLAFECDQCDETHLHLAAPERQRLRVIRPIIDGQLECECVLDSGCETTMMRKDIWEKLGLPLHVNEGVTYTAANKTQTKTMGGLHNVSMNICGQEIFVQYQVVNEAPWEILLGRPVLTHLQCETIDHQDGSQHLIITHPETGVRVQVPTAERPRRTPPVRMVSGFR